MTFSGLRIARAATAPAKPNSRPWRRFLRFSVRAMIPVRRKSPT